MKKFACLILLIVATAAAQPTPVVTGGTNDYAPTIARQGDRLWVIFERQDATFLNGDLYITYSDDWGQTWSEPAGIVVTTGNQSTTSLVAANDSLYLYYASNETGRYQVHLAVSEDGSTWTQQGPLDLGLITGDQYDPTLAFDLTGSWGMLFGYSGSAYFSSSQDGFNWSQALPVAAGERPRLGIDKNNIWQAVMQQNTGGQYQYDIAWYTSPDGEDWQFQDFLTSSMNNHDPFISMLADSSLCCFYSKAVSSQYDLYRRIQDSTGSWLEEQMINDQPGYQTQAHFVLGDSGYICLAYAHSTDQAGTTYDIYFERIPGPTGPGTTTAVSESRPGSRGIMKIHQSSSRVEFNLAPQSPGFIKIYNCTGALIEALEISNNSAVWETGDKNLVPNGIYVARYPEGGVSTKLVIFR